MSTDNEKRIKELEKEIADIRGRIPAHSINPAMIMELEELEDELEKLKKNE
jgi:ribosomal protein L29